MSLTLMQKSFTGTGSSSSAVIQGKANLSLSGFGSATVVLKRAFSDAPTTWFSVQSFNADAEVQIEETELQVLYKLECTVYGSGTIAGRISQ